MKRTLVISAIYGGIKALKQVLECAEVSTEDKLLFLVDYVDGWSESPQVSDFLMELRESDNCILLRGNHDELLRQYLETNSYNELWKIHGGKSTLPLMKI